MRLRFRAAFLSSLTVLLLCAAAPVRAQSSLSPGFAAGEAGLTPSERAGREIWFNATAGNARFHTYVFPQKLGVLIDWYRVLRAEGAASASHLGPDQRSRLLRARRADCPAKSMEETYGFE